MPTEKGLLEFFRNRRDDFRRISKLTAGEASTEDIQQTVWIITAKIEKRFGVLINYCDKNDQETVLRWLNYEFGKYADKSIRHAIRIEQSDEQDSETKQITMLPSSCGANPELDPISILQTEEEKIMACRSALNDGYSEAIAYLILLFRYDGNLSSLADHLRIATATLRARICRAVALAKIQPTIFDGVAVIDPEFVAWKARQKLPMTVVMPITMQSFLEFESAY